MIDADMANHILKKRRSRGMLRPKAPALADVRDPTPKMIEAALNVLFDESDQNLMELPSLATARAMVVEIFKAMIDAALAQDEVKK